MTDVATPRKSRTKISKPRASMTKSKRVLGKKLLQKPTRRKASVEYVYDPDTNSELTLSTLRSLRRRVGH